MAKIRKFIAFALVTVMAVSLCGISALANPTADDSELVIESETQPTTLTAQTISATASDNATITISGSLSEGAYVLATPVSVEIEGQTVLAAYDITIFNPDGTEFQPAEVVRVTIQNPTIEAAKDITVYHMDADSVSPEQIAEVVPNNGTISFTAESFSIYAIVSGSDVPNSYTIEVGHTLQLKNYRGPGQSNQQNGNWSITSGSDVARLPSDITNENTITITALKAGTAIIRCDYTHSGNSYSNTFTVTVTAPTYSHIDVKYAAAVTDGSSSLTITGVSYVGFTSDGINYTQVTGHMVAGEWQCYNHSYTIPNNATVMVTVTLSDTRTITAFFTNGSVYPDHTYYPQSGDASSKLGTYGFPLVTEKGYDISGASVFLVSSIVCNNSDVSSGNVLVDGLDMVLNVQTILNYSASATTQITVTKTWTTTGDPQPPTALTVQLLDDGVAYGAPVTLTAPDWTYTWTVPNNGSTYTVSETVPGNYTQGTPVTTPKPLVLNSCIVVNPCNVLSFADMNSVFVVVKKGNDIYVWTMTDLGSNKAAFVTAFNAQSGTNPFGLKTTDNFFFGLSLPANTIPGVTIDGTAKTLTFSEPKDWSLFAYGIYDADGKNIALSNTFVPQNITISGTKYWPTGMTGLPASITVELLCDGQPLNPAVTKTVTAADEWHYSFTNLNPSHTYTVRETAIAGTTYDSTNQLFKVIGTAGDVTGCWAATVIRNNIYNNYYQSGNIGSGSFAVRKYISDTTTYLAGAVFTLTGSDYSSSQTTNSTADILFSGLRAGTYTLTETPPAGYTGAGPWTVTVSEDGKTFVETTGPVNNIFTNVWKWAVSVTTGSDTTNLLSRGVLTVYNTPIARTFPVYGYKVVTGLTALPENYSATFELRDSGGNLLGTATVNKANFSASGGSFIAPFTFYAVHLAGSIIPMTLVPPPLLVPAGNYTITETFASEVPNKIRSGPTYALTLYSDGPHTTATNIIPISEANSQYDFRVTNSYSDPYYPPTLYTLTVNWVDTAGTPLSDPVSVQISEGLAYNADSILGGSGRTFADHTYKGLADGSATITGYMNGNKTVTFVYNTVIPEESPPLVDIPADQTPLDASPKTGDSSPTLALLWLTLLASFSGLVGLVITDPKMRRKEK